MSTGARWVAPLGAGPEVHVVQESAESRAGPPDSDAEWNRRARNETETERLDRNWNDLLQELRVVQTGVQLLTGLLLTVPFQQRFAELSSEQRTLYLVTLSLSALATGLLVAPVSMHRLLFRRRARRELVDGAHRLALAGLATLGLAVTGVVLLIFDVVVGLTAAIVAGAVTLVVFVLLWGVIPLVQRRRRPAPD
jgi:hypothetical protein